MVVRNLILSLYGAELLVDSLELHFDFAVGALVVFEEGDFGTRG